MQILSNQKQRGVFLQALYLAFWAGLVAIFVLTARSNLSESNIVSGFDFLWKSTGWKVGFSLIEFKASDSYFKVLIVGILNTLFLGFIGLALATCVGVIIGMARTSANGLANLIGAIYVETFRNIPLIVQVFFWYAIMTRFPSPRQALLMEDSCIMKAEALLDRQVEGSTMAPNPVHGLTASVKDLWQGR